MALEDDVKRMSQAAGALKEVPGVARLSGMMERMASEPTASSRHSLPAIREDAARAAGLMRDVYGEHALAMAHRLAERKPGFFQKLVRDILAADPAPGHE